MPHNTAAASRQATEYDAPDVYRNLDDASSFAPLPDPGDGRLRRLNSRESAHGRPSPGFGSSPSDRLPTARRRSDASRAAYDVPDVYSNIPEASRISPVQNRNEQSLYESDSLEGERSRDQMYTSTFPSQPRLSSPVLDGRNGSGADPGPKSEKPAVVEDDEEGAVAVSRAATELYTVSYLVLFAILGTLARLGLQAITFYPGAPVIFSSLWPNFAGSLVLGFLAEDRMLFRFEWGTPTYDQLLRRARRRDVESAGSGSTSTERPRDEDTVAAAAAAADPAIDLAAAKKAHVATKKTIPLYIGLATGFCGSFTSFSSFIRDLFLATSNNLLSPDAGSAAAPRSGGYSFEALLAVALTTVALSLCGLFMGAQLALALEPFIPSLPYALTRRVVDRVAVVLAFGCWLGAILLSALPPDRFSRGLGAAEAWRGRATFALVFAPLGCLARFYASLLLNGRGGRRGAAFPLGTFAVNMVGTAVLGAAYDLAHSPAADGAVGCQVLQGVEDGFCGCLTTVSTWVAELAALRRRHAYVYGAASVVGAYAIMVAVMGGLRWDEGFAPLACIH
ncbi:CrcB-like protein-domain-containing protein [Xylariaceae sp. FL0804]|nr:CrcB-like protein-domain-containing protein [Xylariaceae sp. FL0804]